MNQIKTVELAKVVNWGLLTFVMFWTGLVILCSLYMTIPLLSVFAEEFTITANQAAWAGSIFSIFFAIGCVFFGIMSEKFGLKRVMVFGLLCLGALTILVGFASDFRQLLIFRALQGIASATFSPVAITYIGKVFPPERRVTTLGFLSTGFLFAGIVGQLVSSFIEPRINWQSVFYFFGVVYFITVLLLLLLPQDVRDKNKDLLLIMKKFKIPFQQKTIIITYFISITILLTFVGMYTALGESLKQNFNFNDQQIFLVRAAGGIGILISPFTGKLAKKFSIYPVVYSGFLLAIIGLFSMGFSKDLYTTIIMSVLFVAGIATVVPTLLAIVGDLGGENKGIVTSLYTFILFIGASLGPIISTGIMQTGALTLPFILFGCILLGSLLLTLSLKRIVVKKEIMEQERNSSVM